MRAARLMFVGEERGKSALLTVRAVYHGHRAAVVDPAGHCCFEFDRHGWLGAFHGDLTKPDGAEGLVVFAHGSGRGSPDTELHSTIGGLMAYLLHLRQLSAKARLKLGAGVLLAGPAALLLVLGIAEMVGGDVSGSQHVVQAAPLLLLLAAGWRYPRAAGLVLLGMGTLVFAIWLILVLVQGVSAPRGIAIVAGLIFVLPPLVAGWLMLKASHPPP